MEKIRFCDRYVVDESGKKLRFIESRLQKEPLIGRFISETIQSAIERKDFAGFEFSDGEISASPWRTSKENNLTSNLEHAIAVLFHKE